jgi:hypothetical protein
MKEKISLTALFLVTSFCFFAFSLLLKLLDGNSPAFFLWVGVITMVLGLLNALLKIATSSLEKDKQKIMRQ